MSQRGRSNTHNITASHFVSALSPVLWGLANSVEIYSVRLSQDTLLACWRALEREGVSYWVLWPVTNLLDSGCWTISSSKSASSVRLKAAAVTAIIKLVLGGGGVSCGDEMQNLPFGPELAYVSGRIRSIGTPKSTSVRSSCLWLRSKLVGLYWINLHA